MELKSKLASAHTTIFTEVSALASRHGAVNLGQGFPDFDPPDTLLSLVAKHTKGHTHQYAPMAGLASLREAIANKVGTLYGYGPDPEAEVTITAGATQALFTAITALVHPGDEVIIFEPAYDSYRPSIELSGGKAIPYRMEPPGFEIDWRRVAALVTNRTRMLIINTPHNPTGTILRAGDMEQLLLLVRNTDILILSDEVYEHLVYDGENHQSVIRYPELYSRSLAVFSFGKTYHATGWKLGYVIAPSWLTTEYRKVHQWNVFSVNSVFQYALAEYMEDKDHYLSLCDFYKTKKNLFRSLLEGTGFRPLGCHGTFFQVCDYSDISDKQDTDFARELIVRHKVAAIPMSVFYSQPTDMKLVRFCFAKKEETLQHAGDRLRSVS